MVLLSRRTRLFVTAKSSLAIVLLCVAFQLGLSQENATPAFDAAATEAKASQGDIAAMLQMGNAYWGGHGVPADIEKGRMWLDRAADRGSLEAQMLLGAAFLSGTKMPKDPQLASKYLLRAAQQQNVTSKLQSSEALAQYWVALMYEHGNGLEKSHDKAIQFLQMAANNGNSPAEYDLASLYNEGTGGMTIDKARACDLFEKAADQGYLKAMHNVGYCYQTGAAGKKDESKALDYYTKAAEAGVARAQHNLGVLYGQLGQAEKAYFWLRVAESNGDTETKSLIQTAKQHLTNSELKKVEDDLAAWLSGHKAKKE
jgi:uncharacterized protein